MFCVFLVCCSCNKVKKKDRPNILCLVVEDMSPYLSVYGNKLTNTPTLGALAKNSIVYKNAFSNGAQCSPARSTLISGIYAPMLATDWHRQGRAVPKEFYFTKYLMEAGYYCTNNSKKDYNASNIPKNIWDVSNKKASYLNREDKNQPFFSVFNYGGTHTKRIATRDTSERSPRIIPIDSISLPGYLPNKPEIRDDVAWHLDAVTKMDSWVKKQLDKLKKSGEAEDTIVFFYSDHGGCLPRGKAYLYDTGTRVPLFVYLPEKYKHLVASNVPICKDLVGFVDFAPTFLNLAGVDIPDFMMGKPFLGDDLPEPKSEIFLFRANQEQNFIPSRAISDGRYKLIWNFNSAYPNGTRQSYQWQMPSYQAWDKANINGELDSIQSIFWKPTAPLEFYDTKQDTFELKNLITIEKHQKKISEMKNKLVKLMKDNKDLGLYPWSMRRADNKEAFYTYIKRTNKQVDELINAAVISSTANSSEVDSLITFLRSKEPAIRYWGTVGVLQLFERNLIDDIPKEIIVNFNNDSENIEVRLMSAEILIKYKNDQNALEFVLNKVKENHFIAYATLQNLGELVKPIELDILKLRKDHKLNQFYLKSALINSGYLNYNDLWVD